MLVFIWKKKSRLKCCKLRSKKASGLFAAPRLRPQNHQRDAPPRCVWRSVCVSEIVLHLHKPLVMQRARARVCVYCGWQGIAACLSAVSVSLGWQVYLKSRCRVWVSSKKTHWHERSKHRKWERAHCLPARAQRSFIYRARSPLSTLPSSPPGAGQSRDIKAGVSVISVPAGILQNWDTVSKRCVKGCVQWFFSTHTWWEKAQQTLISRCQLPMPNSKVVKMDKYWNDNSFGFPSGCPKKSW